MTVAFPVDFSHPEKDDQLFERYSDGSMLLYTGHFNVAGQKSHRFVLTPRRGEHLIAGGRVFRRRTKWTDEEGEGTFVYFGKLVPVETPNMIAVIDPAVPKWLQQRLGDAVPRLFADYTKLTGWSADLRSAVGRPPVGRPVSHHGRRTEHPPTADRRSALQYRPTVFFSFEAARDPSSTTWKGGTLPGIIQLHIETAAGAGEDRQLLERFFKFLAHEAAHMWNGQLFKSAEQGQSWMHEGGADAFAWRALRRARASWPTTQPPRGARPGSR